MALICGWIFTEKIYNDERHIYITLSDVFLSFLHDFVVVVFVYT